MNLVYTLKMLILQNILWLLTDYLTVAQQRIIQNEASLNPQTVRDAQQLRELLETRISQLQQLN